MKHLKVMIQGFFVGIALIIPGLSGGTLAVYLGIYEKLLHAIGHVFTEFKRSMTFLIPLFVGIALSVIGLANLLGYLIDVNSLIVLLFFMGLVAGGIQDIARKATETESRITPASWIAATVSFLLVILLVVFGKLDDQPGVGYIDITFWNMLLLVLLGMAASMTMIVPGVSGSALLIVLGYYTAIVTNVAGNVLDFDQLGYNIQVIIPFALGAAIGIILFSKIIEHALKHYAQATYFAILGFILGSVIAIFFEIKDPTSGATHDVQTAIYQDLGSFLGDNVLSLIAALILFAVGFVISWQLTKLELRQDDEASQSS